MQAPPVHHESVKQLNVSLLQRLVVCPPLLCRFCIYPKLKVWRLAKDRCCCRQCMAKHALLRTPPAHLRTHLLVAAAAAPTEAPHQPALPRPAPNRALALAQWWPSCVHSPLAGTTLQHLKQRLQLLCPAARSCTVHASQADKDSVLSFTAASLSKSKLISTQPSHCTAAALPRLIAASAPALH